MNFWEQPQGATVYKHEVLRHYAPIFAARTGSGSKDGTIAIGDGYAGRGLLPDGTPAAAALVAERARDLETHRHIRCWFVEDDKRTYDALKAAVAGTSRANMPVILHGDFVDVLPEVLAATTELPMFVLADPYGSGVPFDTLIKDLLGRTNGWPPTEVLVSFVRTGLHDSAMKLHTRTDEPQEAAEAEAVVKRMNDMLGGDWWHPLLRAHPEPGAFAEEVRRRYVRRVVNKAGMGWRSFTVAVAETPGGRPIYDLILFTPHEQGPWFFNEAVSRSQSVFHQYDGLRPSHPTTTLPSRNEPNAARLRDEWRATIRTNLRGLLEAGKPIAVARHMTEVYGSTLGLARAIHVKAAVRDLLYAGVADADLSQDTHKLIVTPKRRPA